MLLDFLKTKRSKKDLRVALEILKDFEKCESEKEWFLSSFMTWVKLGQLEEYLEHLVNGKELEDDTKQALEYYKKQKEKIKNENRNRR